MEAGPVVVEEAAAWSKHDVDYIFNVVWTLQMVKSARLVH